MNCRRYWNRVLSWINGLVVVVVLVFNMGYFTSMNSCFFLWFSNDNRAGLDLPRIEVRLDQLSVDAETNVGILEVI